MYTVIVVLKRGASRLTNPLKQFHTYAEAELWLANNKATFPHAEWKIIYKPRPTAA